ncbi:MAG: class I SAM-dependent methyltransferase [Phycisphaerae bacterium]|nr:methyltransferase domain-containing protein [Tepidisphaeraceae bacterium]
MIPDLLSGGPRTRSIVRIEADAPVAHAPFTCSICQATQTPPAGPDCLWACGLCNQQYFGGAEPGIVMSDRQIEALRQLAGRDASGQKTLVTNWWTQNEPDVGESFLAFNKNSPARDFTRGLIRQWAAAGEIKSIKEIAFGGLHEFRALREELNAAGVDYSGIDWTAHFVAHAQKEFPNNAWIQGDIVRGVMAEPSDLVYSQHMLEHVPALEPAFSNMLRLAGKRLINIFFIPPKAFEGYEVTNWKQYPLYHNTYSVGHVEAVCRANGFTPVWRGFGQETVLVATRN